MPRYRYDAEKGVVDPETPEERAEREQREAQAEADKVWAEEKRLRDERRVGDYL